MRANQAEWEALGNEGRYHWLGRLRDWILDNLEEISDTVQAETGKVRGDISAELFYVTELINFYGAARPRSSSATKPSAPTRPWSASKKLVVQYRPYPVVGVISPWNFPLAIGTRRLDPGAAGGRRGRRQALRVHPAQHDRGDRGLEGGDRRPRRLRLRARHRRGRRRR